MFYHLVEILAKMSKFYHPNAELAKIYKRHHLAKISKCYHQHAEVVRTFYPRPVVEICKCYHPSAEAVRMYRLHLPTGEPAVSPRRPPKGTQGFCPRDVTPAKTWCMCLHLNKKAG